MNHKTNSFQTSFAVYPARESFPRGVKLSAHLYIVQGLNMELDRDTVNLD
jgi:hypothetical protein